MLCKLVVLVGCLHYPYTQFSSNVTIQIYKLDGSTKIKCMLIRPDIFTKALHTCKCIQASMESLYPILMRICLNTVEKWYNYVQENWHTLKPGSKVAVLNNGEGLCNTSHGCEQGNRPRPTCSSGLSRQHVRSYYFILI